jgi:hypothetical protein
MILVLAIVVWLTPNTLEATDRPYSGTLINGTGSLQELINQSYVNNGDVIIITSNPATGIIYNSNIVTPVNNDRILIPSVKSNLVIQSSTSSSYRSTISSRITSILNADLDDWQTPTNTLISDLNSLKSNVLLLTGYDGLMGTMNTRTITSTTVTNFDYGQIITIQHQADNLSINNINFENFELIYNYGAITAGGATNTFIGNNGNNVNDIYFNEFVDNSFQKIDITFNGGTNIGGDKTYLAGGGIIGLRATAEGVTKGSAKLNKVSGNYFNDINITTQNTQLTTSSPYIEGGGIIGVNAVSSPANKAGVAELTELTYNVFSDIHIVSNDIILGGGIVGINNNSQRANAETAPTEPIASILETVSNNIFGSGNDGDITVTAIYSIRGGGIIGVNGLSEANTYLKTLTNNVFGGIDVTSNSYIKGGGIVGLQSKDVKTDKFPGTTPDYLFLGNSAELDLADGNIFYNINVKSTTTGNTDTFISGGGVIGVRGYTEEATIGTVTNNTFYDINVTSTSGLNTGGRIEGGGIIGASAAATASIVKVDSNLFKKIEIETTGDISGGGIIGAQADTETAINLPVDISVGAVLGTINLNVFDDIKVTVNEGNIYGGGAVGTSTEKGVSVSFGDSNSNSGLTNNKFSQFNVTVSNGGIFGGGLVGATNRNTTGDGSAINYFSFNDMFSNTINADFIEGGGLVGVKSDTFASIGTVNESQFWTNTVTVDYYIDGGGILGVTGSAASSAKTSFNQISNSSFYGNNITAYNGVIYAGLVYTYGNFGNDFVIIDSEFYDNNFTAGFTSISDYKLSGTGSPVGTDEKYGVYGTIVVDTGTALDIGFGPEPAKLILSASNGGELVFRGNKITYESDERYNSVYMGVIPEYEYDGTDYYAKYDDQTTYTAATDAILVIDAQQNGTVALFDPILINQDCTNQYLQTACDRLFQMDVVGAGDFLWGGENEVYVDTPSVDNTISFTGTGRSFIQSGMTLEAENHYIKQNSAGLLQFSGDNYWNVRGVDLSGKVRFNLYSTTRNDPSTAVLKLKYDTLQGNIVDLSGATVSAFASPAEVEAMAEASKTEEQRYYLIGLDDYTNLSDPSEDDVYSESTAPANKTTPLRGYGAKKVDMLVTNDGYDDDASTNHLTMKQLVLLLPVAAQPYTLVPGTQLVIDAQAASMGYLMNTANWLADHSYQQADMALQRSKKTWSPFAGIDGTYIETGHATEVNLNIATALVGVAFQQPFDSSRFLIAGFVEGGLGKYHLYASYDNDPGAIFKAKGEFKSIDVGVIFRQMWDNGFRLEGAARYGAISTEFDSSDLTIVVDSGEEVPAHFDYTVPFLAVHAGIGYEHKLNEVSSLDFVARYYYTSQKGKSVNLNGYTVNFDSLDSHRVRAGVRYSRAHNTRMSYYVGAYAEHDFTQKATGVLHDIKFESEDYGGTTGIGEIGIIFHSTDDRPWNVEAGFQVYGGNIRGFSGGVRFGYQF